jgi:hypothetical protein
MKRSLTGRSPFGVWSRGRGRALLATAFRAPDFASRQICRPRNLKLRRASRARKWSFTLPIGVLHLAACSKSEFHPRIADGMLEWPLIERSNKTR